MEDSSEGYQLKKYLGKKIGLNFFGCNSTSSTKPPAAVKLCFTESTINLIPRFAVPLPLPGEGLIGVHLLSLYRPPGEDD